MPADPLCAICVQPEDHPYHREVAAEDVRHEFAPAVLAVPYVFDPTPACRCSEPRATERVRVPSKRDRKATVLKPIDQCVATLVATLNGHGIETLGSCCGHGDNPGEIILKDGRLLTITENPYLPADPVSPYTTEREE